MFMIGLLDQVTLNSKLVKHNHLPLLHLLSYLWHLNKYKMPQRHTYALSGHQESNNLQNLHKNSLLAYQQEKLCCCDLLHCMSLPKAVSQWELSAEASFGPRGH